MNKNEINKKIVDKVNETRDEKVREFVISVLNFERDYIDGESNRYTSKYEKLIDYYIKGE